MKTTHQILFNNSSNMADILSESIDLVVTSPPYPMIQMWDEIFSQQNKEIEKALKDNNGSLAFELMHKELDSVWNEVWRVLRDGGIVCINIGDAVRTIDSNFALFTNHARIISSMLKRGFSALPEILWRKQTNAPNKFMGSGMLPPGAYVTLEHEFILIFRKGRKREFSSKDSKKNRRESSFFWEERNVWFSDVWMDLKGTSQNIVDDNLRKRSAAFPFEVPYRLINMFSVKGDTVLDPFLGIGTTTYASIAACRNSVGYELDKKMRDLVFSGTDSIVAYANERICNRIQNHLEFINKRAEEKVETKHKNNYYKFPVVTKQETELVLNELLSVFTVDKNKIEANYLNTPQEEYCIDRDDQTKTQISNKLLLKRKEDKEVQLSFIE